MFKPKFGFGYVIENSPEQLLVRCILSSVEVSGLRFQQIGACYLLGRGMFQKSPLIQ